MRRFYTDPESGDFVEDEVEQPQKQSRRPRSIANPQAEKRPHNRHCPSWSITFWGPHAEYIRSHIADKGGNRSDVVRQAMHFWLQYKVAGEIAADNAVKEQMLRQEFVRKGRKPKDAA